METKGKTLKCVTVKALIILLVMTLLCGVIYPLAVTGVSQLFFRDQANGSIIEVDGKKYGSALLAQEFTGDEYLWGRIMNVNLTAFFDDNGNPVVDDNGNPLMYSGPSNKTPAGGELEALVAERVEKIKAAHPKKGDQPIPVDLVTCSGSGLDPEISPAAASYQVERIARERGMDVAEVQDVIAKYTTGKWLGIFGEERVNVLKVNLALDGILK